MDFGIEDDSEDFEDIVNKTPDELKRFLISTKHIFKNEVAFFTWVRSGLRQGLWMKHPVKMEVLSSQRRRIKNPRPNPRKGAETVWGYDCGCCGGQFTSSNVEVDHIVGEHSLKTIDDVVSFFRKIMLVTPEDLQIVCKECHGVKTYSERYGVSMIEAKAVKMAIKVLKDDTWKNELKRLGVNKTIPKVKARKILVDLYKIEYEET